MTQERKSVPEEKLHLGCDDQYREKWHNVDVNSSVRADTHHNLDDPWPFEENEFTRIEANHVFEHLEDLEHAFSESARVLEEDGVLTVRVPIGVDAIADPSHRHQFEWRTPEFFQSSEYSGRNWSYDIPLKLEERQLNVWSFGAFARLNPIYQAIADRWPVAACGLPCSSGELEATFRKLKL